LDEIAKHIGNKFKVGREEAVWPDEPRVVEEPQ
jgi:hypothetical protein